MKYGETRRRWWLIVWTLIAAVGVGSLVWRGAVGQDRAAVEDPAAVAQAKGLSRAFRAAAKKVIPTVVKITSTTKPQVIERDGEMPREDPFNGMPFPFEDFFDEQPFRGFRFFDRIPQRRGLGSGVIIDSSGIILTNNHVVAGADEVLVELSDGREFKATEVKTDELADLAVVRIDVKERLPAATLGDSKRLEIGDWVLAVGNPFNMEHTVSAGIISGKGRSLRARSQRGGMRAGFLQTDAAINPGNSGGPLVNLNGEVVGINTAIASVTGGYQGVGFAIPINDAKWVTEQLIKRGSVQRAYIGVGIGETASPLGRRLGVDRLQGVLVAEVRRGTPAEKAGFQVGDVIRAFASRSVRNPRELQERVEQSSIGSKQRVDVIRDGKPKTLQVVLTPLPDDADVASLLSRGRGKDGSSGLISRQLGLRCNELTEDVARQLGLEGSLGVLVTGVDPRGIGAMAGIREGTIILEVEKKPVKSVADFRAALKGQSLEDGILLRIRTREGDQYVLLQAR